MASQSQVPNLSSLFQSAHDEGDISAQSLGILSVVDVGQLIQAGIGVSALGVAASEVVLVTLEPDDSASILFAGNAPVMCDGHNMVIDALMVSKQRTAILFHTRYLNGLEFNPWCLLEDARRMDSHNYNPDKGTPLYDQTVVVLGSVLAKAKEAKDNGQVARTVTLIMTDGHDEHSVRNTAKDVASLVHDMLMAETHIVALMGIDDGRTDFRQIAREMGIQDNWVLTPGNSPQEIRRAFQTFSSSAVRASQGAQSFSQTAVGGFGV